VNVGYKCVYVNLQSKSLKLTSYSQGAEMQYLLLVLMQPAGECIYNFSEVFVSQ
jgi:hypothetical protein